MRNVNRTIPFLLLSLTALNMPQARVLCVGDDGHIAIEPAGHHHCIHGLHVCDRCKVNLQTDDDSHVDHRHTRPCTDIPIPCGAGDERIVSQKSELNPASVAALTSVISAFDVFAGSGDVVSTFSPLLPSRGDSLRCVVLQV